MSDLDRYVRLMETVFPDPGEAPPLLRRARAVQLVLSGDDLEAAAVREEVPLFHLRRWVEAVRVDGLYGWLGTSSPQPRENQQG